MIPALAVPELCDALVAPARNSPHSPHRPIRLQSQFTLRGSEFSKMRFTRLSCPGSSL